MTLATGVAPMEGVSILPNRVWWWLASQPGAMTTPFLRVTREGTTPALPIGFVPELLELRGVFPYELAPQLLTPDPEAFLRWSELLPPGLAPFVELNCGCPAPSSSGKSAGSGMLRDPDAFGRTLERLAAALGPGRFAVKMRIGYDRDAELDQLLPHVASLPLARLTVHGRTRADGYRGRARWGLIEAAAKRAQAPTWASGDVLGAATLARLGAAAPSTSGVMIGRGALRNPWVFEELRRGEAIAIDVTALRHAVLCFALLNELWLRAPDRLLQRLASGKIDARPCGTDPDAWERLAATLTGLAFGAPGVLSPRRATPDLPVSPTTVGRVRMLWGYLRTGLPPELAAPRLMRAKRLADLLDQIAAAAPGPSLALGHRPEWDELFSPSTDPDSVH